MSGFPMENPSLLQSVFENVNAALAVIDSGGRLVFSNPAFAILFGVARETNPVQVEVWARTLFARGYRFQDDRGSDIAIDASKVTGALVGEQVQPCDFRLIFPDGSWKWIHATSHLFSVVGLAGVLVIATDETVHVELRNITARLERLETFEAVSRLLAHDFINMLQVISANADLVAVEADVPETTRTHLQAISETSQKAMRVGRRLIQFGRPRTPEVRPTQINDLITEVLQLVRPLLRSGIIVKADLNSALPMVDADPLQIDQLLINLIVNAVDAMPQGGELRVSTNVGRLDRSKSKDDRIASEAVLISVSDTGIGIPQAVQSEIFEPFFTTKQKGTGLGLSSVYGIVQQHGGDIKVRSEPQKGTTFVITFPATAT